MDSLNVLAGPKGLQPGDELTVCHQSRTPLFVRRDLRYLTCVILVFLPLN